MSDERILSVSDLGMSSNGRVLEPVTIATDDKKKPVLPDVPRGGDRVALETWLTVVLRLDPHHPIVDGRHLGAAGGNGIVELLRFDAPPLVFDPAYVIGKGDTLLGALVWQLIDSDDEPIAWTKVQAQKIELAVARLCRRERERGLAADADHVVTTLLQVAERIEGPTTYGTSAQRYGAGKAITAAVDDFGRPLRPRYLVDAETGELVIRVSDAQRVARQLHGSLRHGWLDGVFEAFGWHRITLEGYELRGRDDRSRGGHHRSEAYRGRLPESPDDQGSVTT